MLRVLVLLFLLGTARTDQLEVGYVRSPVLLLRRPGGLRLLWLLARELLTERVSCSMPVGRLRERCCRLGGLLRPYPHGHPHLHLAEGRPRCRLLLPPPLVGALHRPRPRRRRLRHLGPTGLVRPTPLPLFLRLRGCCPLRRQPGEPADAA
jgi:hypothetical protein